MNEEMKHSSLIKNDTKRNYICFTILMALVWSDSILLPFLRVFMMKVPYVWQHADMIISIVYVGIFLLAIAEVIRGLYVKEMFIVIGFCGFFALHYLLFPLNKLYYEDYWEVVVKESIPMFLVGACVYRINRERVLKILNTISLVTVFAYFAYMLFFRVTDGKTLRTGDMHSAYMLLPHICLVFSSLLRKADPWKIAGFALGGVQLLFLGNRGSLLCLGVFVIFTILFSGRLKRPVLFLILTTSFMLALFAFGLLDFLYDMAEKFGFSLRIFQKLESGEIASTSGRDKISSRVWQYIKMYPLLGLGIFSDRRVAGGFYAHNIFLEFMIHYGIIGGLALLGYVIYIFVLAFLHMRRTKQAEALDFYLAVFFAYIFKLLLSNSYLLEPYFFFTLGFAYAAIQEHNRLRRKPNMKRGLKKLSGRRESDEQQTENLCNRDEFRLV